MNMRFSVVVGILLLSVGSVHAQTTHCLDGCPVGAPTANTTINRVIYTLNNNPVTKFADWLAYRIDPASLTGPSRNRNWAIDPDLSSTDTLKPSEYSHANVALGVDRGHQAPLGSFKGAGDWRHTNYLSNITPQFTKLNQGAWKELEEAIRDLARADTSATVFVMTGPLYEWPMAKLPNTDKNHQVPSAYWKIVARQGSAGDVSAAAFYFYQDTPKRANYCDHMKTVRFIEQKTGFDFFSGMADPEESVLETSSPTIVSGLGC